MNKNKLKEFIKLMFYKRPYPYKTYIKLELLTRFPHNVYDDLRSQRESAELSRVYPATASVHFLHKKVEFPGKCIQFVLKHRAFTAAKPWFELKGLCCALAGTENIFNHIKKV